MTKEQKIYLLEQDREGFRLPKGMKNIWAAQLVMYQELREVLERNNITYWAGFGTLLGAARHHGYIPWDDDFDLYVERSSYDRLLKYCIDELKDLGYKFRNIHIDHEYDSMMTRVFNSREPDFSPYFLDKWVDCPFVIGIDLFPIDYLPDNEEEYQAMCRLLVMIEKVAKTWHDRDQREENKNIIKVIEASMDCTVDLNGFVPYQLRMIAENVGRRYNKSNSNSMGILALQPNINHKWQFNKEWMDGYTLLRFENTDIRVPIKYKEVLDKVYGDWHTIWRGHWHTYPYYKDQEPYIINNLKDRLLRLKDFPDEESKEKEIRDIKRISSYLITV